ncbi:PilW family protein [Pseudoalteromonas denitrificans]|uniref:Type IV pilus assembly protein PilW n=1 Tax=Pseudoalteromonas denitrificans DSM 6059 TaxID=1123010 RepID=A0A1I1QRH6_9GAMM|nr:PilW family protein [Pseudoalteromonas denitrificans]SFD24734.1 type IV pilus assembly protein PilW [Pseudoalteromonas denitrificans DSM 6059]
MRQRGFTIIELMISMIVSLFILSGVMFTYLSMKITTKATLEIGELQESARLAMDILSQDVQQAGFWGTYYGSTLDSGNIVSPAAPIADCSEGDNNASFPNNPTSNFRYLYGIEASSSSVLGCISNTVTNSDVIQIKRLEGNNVNGIATNSNRYYLLVDQNSGTIFPGTGAAPVLPQLNSTVWPYNHHVYYIAKQSYNSGTKNITVPVLMRKRLTVNGGLISETIMEGIENMRFIYGLDSDGDNRVDIYKTAIQMAAVDWEQSLAKILSVQIFLLVRSLEEDSSSDSVSKTYTLGGSTDADKRKLSFNDKYRRILLVSTVKISNSGQSKWQ